MSTRWLTLTLVTVFALYSHSAAAQQTGQREDSATEEARGPGRFFRKLREDFSGRKEEEEKAKSESTRTADRREPSGRETSGFQPLFSPPAFLSGASSRSTTEQDPQATTERGPFRFSQPTLPPPVANSLPKPLPNSARQVPNASAVRQPNAALPAPRSVLSGASSGQAAAAPASQRGNQNAYPGVSRQLDLPAGPTRRLTKPSLEKGFGFELVDREDGLYISAVASRGNADQAELKKGDQILKIGGVEVEQKQQFEEIAEMLESGDQIEVSFARRGKEEEVLLQFGEPPVADAPNSAELSIDKVSDALPSPLPNFKLSDPDEIPDFAPPVSGSSRYEPGVTELSEAGVEGSSRQTSNGFRSPTLPTEQKGSERPDSGPVNERRNPAAGYSEAELLLVIRQQQDTIRQLQFQVQQLKLLQQQAQQATSTSKQRGKR